MEQRSLSACAKHELTALELGRDVDLWVCVKCPRVFFFEDDKAWTGTGNHDELRWTEQPELVEAFVRRGSRSVAEVAARVGELEELQKPVRDLVWRAVAARDPELHRADRSRERRVEVPLLRCPVRV